MPYCHQCGKEFTPEKAFCSHCGAQLKRDPSKRIEKKPTTTRAKQSDTDVKTLLNLSVYLFGGTGILSLIMGDALGVVLAGALAAALYFWGLKKFEENELDYPKNISLLSAVVAGLLGLFIVFSGHMLGIINIAVAIPPFMVWQKLQTIK